MRKLCPGKMSMDDYIDLQFKQKTFNKLQCHLNSLYSNTIIPISVNAS
jgi:hypothetical protein